jgi:hypothetical protein
MSINVQTHLDRLHVIHALRHLACVTFASTAALACGAEVVNKFETTWHGV